MTYVWDLARIARYEARGYSHQRIYELRKYENSIAWGRHARADIQLGTAFRSAENLRTASEPSEANTAPNQQRQAGKSEEPNGG